MLAMVRTINWNPVPLSILSILFAITKPSLRMHPVAPPSELTAAPSGSYYNGSQEVFVTIGP
jgi:hypothetical protein